MTKGKEIWDSYADGEAYFAVLSEERFRSRNLDDAAKREFLQSGRDHVSLVWNELAGRFGVNPSPKRSLDYGCGVGRLLIPIAERSETAIGVDISEKMLAEASRNAASAGIDSCVLQTAYQFAAADDDRYDFVHTYIVLQHIVPRIGVGIIEKMLERLQPGGHGMIHLTHRNTNRSFARLRADIYRDYPVVHRALNAIRGRSEPIMPMYEYDLDRVYKIFDSNACVERFEKETNHTGILGRMIFFRKDVEAAKE